jgi:hypothetical protein
MIVCAHGRLDHLLVLGFLVPMVMGSMRTLLAENHIMTM